MKPSLKVFLVLSPLLFFLTCLDNIDLNIPPTKPSLVISGTIYNTPGPYYVTLTESAPFVSGPEGDPDRVTGAIVKILDNLGNVAILTEIEEGKYSTSADGIRGQVGNSYWVEIEVNEKQYQSRPEKMPALISAESLEIELSSEEQFNRAGNLETINFVNLLVNTQFPNTEPSSFLKWNISGVYQFPDRNTFDPRTCYITENLNFDNVTVAASTDIANNFLQKQEILTTEADFRFAFRYCFKVAQQAITVEAYNFWSGVAEEKERSGSILETIPGKIKGNVFNTQDNEEEVLGFFAAAAVDTIELLVSKEEVGSPRQKCTELSRFLQVCSSCLSAPNSSLVKPACFD